MIPIPASIMDSIETGSVCLFCFAPGFSDSYSLVLSVTDTSMMFITDPHHSEISNGPIAIDRVPSIIIISIWASADPNL